MNSDFALAVHSLVLLSKESNKVLTSSYISKCTSVHPVRIRKILSLLRKEGYIESKEGAKGGFLITYNPNEVKLDEIYKLTDRNLLKPKCHESSNSCQVGSNIETILDDIFGDADEHLQKFLSQFTIQMVIDKLENT